MLQVQSARSRKKLTEPTAAAVGLQPMRVVRKLPMERRRQLRKLQRRPQQRQRLAKSEEATS